MNSHLFGALTNAQISAQTNYDVPQGATGVYISSDIALRVSTDGITNPTANIGLIVPGSSTAIFAIRPNVVGGLKIFPLAANANISIQFLGSVR